LTDQLESALALAEECCAKFKQPLQPFPNLTVNGKCSPYFDSVRSIPRASTFMGGDDDPSTPAELKALVTCVAKGTHERYLVKLIHV
jgi:hypothetical protein